MGSFVFIYIRSAFPLPLKIWVKLKKDSEVVFLSSDVIFCLMIHVSASTLLHVLPLHFLKLPIRLHISASLLIKYSLLEIKAALVLKISLKNRKSKLSVQGLYYLVNDPKSSFFHFSTIPSLPYFSASASLYPPGGVTAPPEGPVRNSSQFKSFITQKS